MILDNEQLMAYALPHERLGHGEFGAFPQTGACDLQLLIHRIIATVSLGPSFNWGLCQLGGNLSRVSIQ